jgi:ParB family chromosome partitioning protein
MSPLPLTVFPTESEDISEVSQADAILLKRLGMEALPAHETLLLPVERLIVVDAEHLARSAKRLVKSIQRVGLLQSPSVAVQGKTDIHDPDATFEVIAGRRRVLAARFAGLPVIKCEVYAASTLPFSALLALIENEQRSAAWVKEVEALRQLLDEQVGMTLNDLAAFGFDRAQLSERLKIARLPAPLLERVLAGDVSREVARKLVRLTQTQQERVAALAAAGEEISAERVKDLLRAQIAAGLTPLQTALSQGWDTTAWQIPALSTAAPYSSEPPPFDGTGQAQGSEGQTEAGVPEAYPVASSSSLHTVLTALHAFEQSAEYQSLPQAVHSLTVALSQQLRLILRQRAGEKTRC